MFNEERLTKKMSFSKKARAAFSLSANAGKENARAFACRPLFVRKSASQGFAPHAFFVAASLLLKFALFGFCLAFVSCANIFQDKVAMSRSGASATLGDIFLSGATAGKLDTPSQINVSQYEYKDKIRVSWSPVKNASYYILKRAVVEKDVDGNWKKMKDDVSLDWKDIGRIYVTSYTDTIITDNWNNDDALDYNNKKYKNAYYYSVSAGNALLGYDDSEEKNSTWGALLPPPTETRASLGSSDEHIKITWKKSDGAVRYDVYRSLQTDGKQSTKIAELYPTATSYQDNKVSSFKGANLFYTVCSVGYHDTSVASSVAMGYTSRPGAPKGVNNVWIKEGHGENKDSIEIGWEAVEGEGILYNIYRSDSNDSTLVELATEISVAETSGTYKDDGSKAKLKQNVYYYYYVQSYKKVKENGEEVIYQGPMSYSGPSSDLEEAYSDKYAEGFILSAPSSVEVQKPDIKHKNDPYTILFTPSIGDNKFSQGAKGEDYNNNYEYIVYGGDSENGSFSNELKRFSSSDLEFANGKYSAKVPQYKFYKMQVKNKDTGKESEETAAVAPAPYAPTDVYVTCAALVGDYSNYKPNSDPIKTETDPGSNSNGVHPVKIVWTAPEGDDAAYYNVYRKTNINGGWGTPINPEPFSKTYYIDENENAKVDTIYYYSVISLNSLKQGANRSAVEKPTLIGNKENAIIKTYNIEIDGKATRCGKGWGWGALSAWKYIQEMCRPIEKSHKKCTPLQASSNLDKADITDVPGDLCGNLHYDAKSKLNILNGKAYAILEYKDYADYYINDDSSLGYSFLLNGHTDTDANLSANGTMIGSVTCKGMYPGSVTYDKIVVKAGDSGGGYYILIREGVDESSIKVDYMAGKNIRK